MKLSQQVLIGLKRLGNPTLVPEEGFELLLKRASAVLLDHSKGSDIDFGEISTFKPDILKETFASLLILLVEGSRHNLETHALLSTLEHYNLNISRLGRIAELYEANKLDILAPLKNIGSPHSKIIDVKWRLDFCIKSSSMEYKGNGVYLIQIVTEQLIRKNLNEDSSVIKKICFTCSLQQIQELVARLKEITRLINVIAYPK